MKTLPKTFLLSVLTVLALSWELHAAEDLKIAFDAQGLSSIVHNGVELLKAGDQQAMRLSFQHMHLWAPGEKGGVLQAYPPKLLSSVFDAQTKTLKQEYPWCSLSCAYIPGPDALELDLTVKNKADKPICSWAILGPRFVLPHIRANERIIYAWRQPIYVHDKGVFGIAGADLGDRDNGLKPLVLPAPIQPRGSSIRSSTSSGSPTRTA